MNELEKSGITEMKVVSATFTCGKCNGVYQIGGSEYNTCTCINLPIKIPRAEGRIKEVLERWFEEIQSDPSKILYLDDEPLTEEEENKLYDYIDMISHICMS